MTGEWAQRMWAGALTVLLAVLVPAAVARADEKDAEFANYLEAHGIHLGTAAQVGNMARVMCQDLDSGLTQADEVKQMTDHQVSQAHAEFFVGAATAVYCPQHRSSPASGS